MLTIFRKTESRTFPVTIIREEIRAAERARQDGRAGLRLDAREPVPGPHGRRLRRARSRSSTSRSPNLKGLVLDLRNDPGGLLEGAVAISAAFLPERRRSSSRPTARSPSRKSTFKAAPEFYQRRGGSRPAAQPARRR